MNNLNPHRRRLLSLALVGLAGAAFLTSPAANWPQWRGPQFDGSTTDTGVPASFSKEENLKWVADMPGPAAATPVVWEDKVFVSSTDAGGKKLVALAYDRATGRLLWREEVAEGFGRDNLSNFANPSPVTDGRLVWFYYGQGDLVCFETGGKKSWARNLAKDYGQFAFLWTYGASPLLHDGRLILQVLQRNVPVQGRGRSDGPNDSYVLALDPATGKELWRVIRPTEAREESHEAYSTPTPVTHAGRAELLIVGGDLISGHDPKTGRELWQWGTWNPSRITHWRLVPSPVTGEGILLACAPKGSPVYAFKLGATGNLPEDAPAWISKEREVSSDVSTPLFYKGRFYVLNSDRRTISRVEPATGKVEWTGEVGARSKIEASPTAADDRIYFQSHGGEVFVVAAAPEFKVLHSTLLGEENERYTRASLAIAHGQLFVRTGKKLYCFGK